jgi:hypothetical protein
MKLRSAFIDSLKMAQSMKAGATYKAQTSYNQQLKHFSVRRIFNEAQRESFISLYSVISIALFVLQ